MFKFKFVATAFVIVAFISTAAVQAVSPWQTAANLSLTNNAVGELADQPEGVKVKFEDGHLIVDFKQRAEMKNVESELFSPFADEPMAENPDSWSVNLGDPLDNCFAACVELKEEGATQKEIDECYRFCWVEFGIAR